MGIKMTVAEYAELIRAKIAEEAHKRMVATIGTYLDSGVWKLEIEVEGEIEEKK